MMNKEYRPLGYKTPMKADQARMIYNWNPHWIRWIQSDSRGGPSIRHGRCNFVRHGTTIIQTSKAIQMTIFPTRDLKYK
eukprot:scaffold178854_cov58-Attheya_sp.AAC.4